jgi:protease IV
VSFFINQLNPMVMKKNPLRLIIFFTLVFSMNLRSQDFNLFNPGNEIYLFSAYDEGANAFRYNPAVLGLGHRLNVSLNAFLESYQNELNLNELDLSINSGALGLAYRNTHVFYKGLYNEENNYFSLGFGIGNKTISSGLLLEYTVSDITKKPDYFDYGKSRFNFGGGLLYRPNKVISTAFVIRTKKSLSKSEYLGVNFTLGTALRPLFSDKLSLMLDFGFIPYVNRGFFENHMLKLGVDFKPAKGFHLFGGFTRYNSGTITDYVNLGIRFDLPNFEVRYTNSFNKFTDRDNSFTSYKSAGQQISLSYNLEKRETIVRERKKIFELTLSGSLQDYNTEDIFFGILGKGKRSVHEVIADIDYAAKDESVSGMLLKIYPLSAGRIFDVSAAIEELTNSLERFRKTGKKITAYFPQMVGPSEYYIGTYADKIIMPEESILFYGLSIEVINFKQFLEKYGIGLQNFYAGKYKLTFQGLLDSTTAEGKEVINRILDVVYDKMLDRIQRGRNLTIDDYLRMKLSQPLTGMEAKRLGLVDENGWYPDAKDKAEKESGTGNIFSSINRSRWDEQWSEPNEIAVIGVYSTITSGESQAPDPISLPIPFFGGGRSTGSETVVRQLEDAFSNPKVKVVILRVNSGGGSALASAEINSAIIRLKKKYKKPFLVSMGGAAASGGYYVSLSADKIFCDELTITGSIGVFGSIPNLDSLLREQKIKIETFKRGENSDMISLVRELNDREKEIIQGIIDFYYERFISAIEKGRNLSKEEAGQVAQGRVWLGTDAFNKRLVDELGGLYEAVKYAKMEGKLGSRFKLVYYAVPGGDAISEIVTTSLIHYLQQNLIKMLGFDDKDDFLDINY